MKIYAAILCMSLAGCTANTGMSPGKQAKVMKLQDMHRVEVGHGEVVYQAEGKDHGMQTMSFVITETEKGGGPPLHTHPVEEVHVVLQGTVTYFIADSIFSVDAPFIVHIPANTPHTFINSGDTVLNLVGVFGQDNFGPYKPIGKNPLMK